MLARNGFTFRRANSNDIAELVRIESLCFESDRISLRSFRSLVRGSRAAVVAAADGGLAGYVLVLFRRNSRIARIYSLAVDPRYKGGGLGARLILAAEQESMQRGCNRIRLEVRATNPRAIALYERLGYAHQSTADGYYADGCAARRYGKRLPGAAAKQAVKHR